MTDAYYLTREDRDKINRLLAMVGGASGMDLTPGGLIVHPSPASHRTPPTPRQLHRFRFHSEENDYIVCHTWDGETEGTDAINIAKPLKLRHDEDNYEGVVNLSTTSADEVDVDDDDELAETWKVTPSYQADDEIYAIRVGGTNVVVSSVELLLEDINTAGRAWAVYEE